MYICNFVINGQLLLLFCLCLQVQNIEISDQFMRLYVSVCIGEKLNTTIKLELY